MGPYLKAAATFAGAFILALWATLQDRTDLDSMTTSNWVLVVLGSLATTVLMFYTPYKSTRT
jgi:Flp pilus assembly protein protease CpaA